MARDLAWWRRMVALCSDAKSGADYPWSMPWSRRPLENDAPIIASDAGDKGMGVVATLPNSTHPVIQCPRIPFLPPPPK